jgi:hypothetical protein
MTSKSILVDWLTSKPYWIVDLYSQVRQRHNAVISHLLLEMDFQSLVCLRLNVLFGPSALTGNDSLYKTVMLTCLSHTRAVGPKWWETARHTMCVPQEQELQPVGCIVATVRKLKDSHPNTVSGCPGA